MRRPFNEGLRILDFCKNMKSNQKKKTTFTFYCFKKDCENVDYNAHVSYVCSFGEDVLENAEFYGKFNFVHEIWKRINVDYVGISLDGSMPALTSSELENYMSKGISLIGLTKGRFAQPISEIYKERYYYYDLNVLRKVIQNSFPTLFQVMEKSISSNEYIIPSFIVKKDLFRKMCACIFPILNSCSLVLRHKQSFMQNAALEHLGVLLLSVYISSIEGKHTVCWCNRIEKKKTPTDENGNKQIKGSLRERAQELVSEGKVEDAIICVEEHKEDGSYAQLKEVFDNYSRQRRYFQTTDLDRNPNLDALIDDYSKKKNQKNKESKILIIEWNSINNDDILNAFKALGYEIDTLYATEIRKYRSDNMERILRFLDGRSYDFVFSVNYFDYVSEACYVHDIPYIAWAYDSPMNMGDLRYARYGTTHIFAFDSDEVNQYRIMGFDNVHYLPLAVNLKNLDSIICDDNDIERYKAELSFVGQLYDTRLTEYLNYLPDYKKGFFNALLDYNTGHYGSYTVEDVFSMDISEWLNEKAFREAVYRGESKHPKSPLLSDDMEKAISPRVGLLTNTTITNRERLLLISMLSNHWEFKLYSDTGADIFKNVKEMGRVDYYTEMPKVFKCSKINLNITYKNIKTGIPQRCLDIMGCGGFLLTNYQRDFDEHFKDGENIAIYRSFDEAFEKCEYYLSHESERKSVAEKGYETIKTHYTYVEQLKKAIRESGLEWTMEG